MLLLFCVTTPCGTIPGSALKMETLCCSETLVSTYESTRRRNNYDDVDVDVSLPIVGHFLFLMPGTKTHCEHRVLWRLSAEVVGRCFHCLQRNFPAPAPASAPASLFGAVTVCPFSSNVLLRKAILLWSAANFALPAGPEIQTVVVLCVPQYRCINRSLTGI
jgi:hypothetical protein